MRHNKQSKPFKVLLASPSPTGSSTTNWEKAKRKHNNRKQQQKSGSRATSSSSKKVKSSRNEWQSPRDSGTPGTTRKEMLMDIKLKLFAERVALSPDEKQLRATVFEDVRDLISSTFQDATVQLYGSSSTGLDTFRSDLDITVGNISLSSSQPLPSITVVDELGEELEDQQNASNNETDVSDPVLVEQEQSSFSLNLALPIGSTSVDSADITRRVQPTAASHWNPTLRRRKIRVLRALQLMLNARRPHFRVKCLHKAKIPILMVLDTKTKLAIDIGVNNEMFEASEHGRSTSLARRLQATLGARFTIMVMFLKEFLHQFELDKPFTGGIGSFRLYMMVAFIFQQCKPKHDNEPQPPVSSLLLAFFELYGNKKLPGFLRENTQLPLALGDRGYMDFGGVFRIDDCVETFAMAFDILSSTGTLGSIIYEERIDKDRKKCSKNMNGRSIAATPSRDHRKVRS
uniref:Poly(A) RNA polymerase mitochondrial-like central palm domain-containing protein n=1 Tax=Peronospora matthiolae TaxID=2874970 RepID=A0AAV1UHK5_9STRA